MSMKLGNFNFEKHVGADYPPKANEFAPTVDLSGYAFANPTYATEMVTKAVKVSF
jgi:hypothetical protein